MVCITFQKDRRLRGRGAIAQLKCKSQERLLGVLVAWVTGCPISEKTTSVIGEVGAHKKTEISLRNLPMAPQASSPFKGTRPLGHESPYHKAAVLSNFQTYK